MRELTNLLTDSYGRFWFSLKYDNAQYVGLICSWASAP